MSSNLSVLTRSHKVAAAKRRQKREQIKEIVFDDEARLEFLTGFHKRKLAKQEAGKKKAIEREKAERLELRREKRQMLAQQAAENAKKVETAYGGAALENGSDDEWDGFGSEPGPSSPPTRDRQDEYSDEEQLATVTVVEDFDPSSLIHGTSTDTVPSENANASGRTPVTPPVPTKSLAAKSSSGAAAKKKVRPKDIKYETKAARKTTRAKQHARKTEKAERAGGKASRRKGTGGKASSGKGKRR